MQLAVEPAQLGACRSEFFAKFAVVELEQSDPGPQSPHFLGGLGAVLSLARSSTLFIRALPVGLTAVLRSWTRLPRDPERPAAIGALESDRGRHGWSVRRHSDSELVVCLAFG
jgi:hypothetical protein